MIPDQRARVVAGTGITLVSDYEAFEQLLRHPESTDGYFDAAPRGRGHVHFTSTEAARAAVGEL